MAGKLSTRVVLFLLIAGAVIFVLLLAGVGSDALTDPKPYLPSG
jgi:hypothetical protein